MIHGLGLITKIKDTNLMKKVEIFCSIAFILDREMGEQIVTVLCLLTACIGLGFG